MKKQINPTVRAYLIRSAFYLVLLMAVCAIPIALAQSRHYQWRSGQTNGSLKLASTNRTISTIYAVLPNPDFAPPGVIAEQSLKPGTKLPSIRSFAATHGVSVFTVVEAYDPTTDTWQSRAAYPDCAVSGKVDHTVASGVVGGTIVVMRDNAAADTDPPWCYRAYRYDPVARKYVPYAMGMVRAGALLVLFGLASALFVYWRREVKGARR